MHVKVTPVKKRLMKGFLIIFILYLPVLLYNVWFFVQINAYDRCDSIQESLLTGNKEFTREYIEKKALRGFRRIDAPGEKRLRKATRYYAERFREKGIPVRISLYNRSNFCRCFEVIYSEDGEALKIIGPKKY